MQFGKFNLQHHWILKAGLLCILSASNAFGQPVAATQPQKILFQDDFKMLQPHWITELEKPGEVTAANGELIMDVPAGATVWLNQKLTSPIIIRYKVLAVSAGGANDRLSDLNCFWMATDIRNPENILQVQRHGAFKEYDLLKCYYVGLGANNNTTTRFRRYIGQTQNRPLLPEHDLKAPLLEANKWNTVTITCIDGKTTYSYNNVVIFSFDDPEPYLTGWFAFRTVTSHFKIRDFEIIKPDTAK